MERHHALRVLGKAPIPPRLAQGGILWSTIVLMLPPLERSCSRIITVWMTGSPLVEIAAISAACRLQRRAMWYCTKLAHILAPGIGHGKVWRYATRREGRVHGACGLRNPRA